MQESQTLSIMDRLFRRFSTSSQGNSEAAFNYERSNSISSDTQEDPSTTNTEVEKGLRHSNTFSGSSLASAATEETPAAGQPISRSTQQGVLSSLLMRGFRGRRGVSESQSHAISDDLPQQTIQTESESTPGDSGLLFGIWNKVRRQSESMMEPVASPKPLDDTQLNQQIIQILFRD